MKLYLLACGFLMMSAVIAGRMFPGSLDGAQLWMPVSVALCVLAAMVCVGGEIILFTMGRYELVHLDRLTA